MNHLKFSFIAIIIFITGFQTLVQGSAFYPVLNSDSLRNNSRWEPPVFHSSLLPDSLNSADKNVIITISTTPDDAELLADSVYFGRTPAKIPYISKLTLRKKGFAEREIYPAETDQMQNFELVRLAPPNKESFFQTNTFTLVSAAIIVLGGTAAYLKIQADGQFEEYQRTGNDTYLSKTRQYDLYSGLAFGVMQINFGYLVYKFLVNP